MKFGYQTGTLSLILVILCGCTTTRTSDTSRTATEQLLISNAVDQTLAKAALPHVQGRKVFIEEKYLESVDKGYVVAQLRQKLLGRGARLVDKKEDSEITVEVCSGAIGTDNNSSFVGMPGLTVPGLPVELPEVRMYEKTSQFGTAKLGVVAYSTSDGQLLQDGVTSLARADDSRWSVMGLGPFHDGSVRTEVMSQTGERDLAARVAETINLNDDSTTELKKR